MSTIYQWLFSFFVEDNLKSLHNCCNQFSAAWKSHHHLIAFQSSRKKAEKGH